VTRMPPDQLNSTCFDWTLIAASPTAVGHCRNFFDAATRTLERLECHASTVNAGEASHAAHRHPDEELVIVKEGELEVTVNGVSRVVGPGGLCFFAANDLHGMRNPGHVPATYFVVRIFPRDLHAAAPV